MLRFDATTETGPSLQFPANVDQLVDLTEYASLIAAGNASINLSAFFNRVDFDSETDSLLILVLDAQDAAGSTLAFLNANLFSDNDVGTWEAHSASLLLPTGTVQVQVRLLAWENVFNDAVAPEFDGHYVDDVELWISP